MEIGIKVSRKRKIFLLLWTYGNTCFDNLMKISFSMKKKKVKNAKKKSLKVIFYVYYNYNTYSAGAAILWHDLRYWSVSLVPKKGWTLVFGCSGTGHAPGGFHMR